MGTSTLCLLHNASQTDRNFNRDPWRRRRSRRRAAVGAGAVGLVSLRSGRPTVGWQTTGRLPSGEGLGRRSSSETHAQPTRPRARSVGAGRPSDGGGRWGDGVALRGFGGTTLARPRPPAVRGWCGTARWARGARIRPITSITARAGMNATMRMGPQQVGQVSGSLHRCAVTARPTGVAPRGAAHVPAARSESLRHRSGAVCREAGWRTSLWYLSRGSASDVCRGCAP